MKSKSFIEKRQGEKRKVKVKLLSCVQLAATPWTAAYQAPLSMGFSRQEYWSRVPLSSAIAFSSHREKTGGKKENLPPNVNTIYLWVCMTINDFSSTYILCFVIVSVMVVISIWPQNFFFFLGYFIFIKIVPKCLKAAVLNPV